MVARRAHHRDALQERTVEYVGDELRGGARGAARGVPRLRRVIRVGVEPPGLPGDGLRQLVEEGTGVHAGELLVGRGARDDPATAIGDARGEQRIAHGLRARRALRVTRGRTMLDEDLVEDIPQHRQSRSILSGRESMRVITSRTGTPS